MNRYRQLEYHKREAPADTDESAPISPANGKGRVDPDEEAEFLSIEDPQFVCWGGHDQSSHFDPEVVQFSVDFVASRDDDKEHVQLADIQHRIVRELTALNDRRLARDVNDQLEEILYVDDSHEPTELSVQSSIQINRFPARFKGVRRGQSFDQFGDALRFFRQSSGDSEIDNEAVDLQE